LIASSGFISAIARSPKGFLASSLFPGNMAHDKKIFIDRLNKVIWQIQVLRNKIEESRVLDDFQAHIAMDTINLTRRELKSLSKEVTAIYKKKLTWK